MPVLLVLWREQVKGFPEEQEHRYECYRPMIPVDVATFWHPALKNCPSKHYHPAGQAGLTGVDFWDHRGSG